MPSVKYLVTLSNADGYEGLEEEQELTAEMDIPDGYNDNELKHIINEIKVELPYRWYQNVIVAVNDVQVCEKAVDVFDVKGDNIGKEQKRYLSRVYDAIAAGVMLERTKTPPGITPQNEIKLEKVLDGIKNAFSNAFSKVKETVSAWFDGFLERKKTQKEAWRLEKEQLHIKKEQAQKQRLEELEAERKLVKLERLFEKEKTARMKVEEELEKIKLARIKEEAKLAKIKKLQEENKKLKEENKELEMKLSLVDTKIENMLEKIQGVKKIQEVNQQQYEEQYYKLEKIQEAEVNQQQYEQQYYGR